MGDLAARPRGGWQVSVGPLFGRKTGLRGPYGPDNPDPAPDCYSVERLGADVFMVRHFPNAETKKPCCVAKVSRKHAAESDVAVLLRASRLCEERHEGALAGAIA